MIKNWFHWLVFQVLSLVVALLGLLVVPVLAYTRSWKKRFSRSHIFQGREVMAWRYEPFTLPWGNEEDGVIGHPSWLPGKDDRYRAMRWSFRNNAYGLRVLLNGEITLHKPVVTKKIIPGFKLCISGNYQCLHVFGVFRFGWRMYPESAVGDISWPVFFK